MNANELEDLARFLLEEGVPAGVVSRALRVDLEAVKELRSKIRIQRYGTDDITDYLEDMQWKAIEEAMQTISKGSAADKAKYLQVILGKQMALAGRRTPESQKKNTDALLDVLQGMREDKPQKKAQPSPFTVVAGNLDNEDDDEQDEE